MLILVLWIVERSNMGYLSIKQTSDKWGISVRRIQVLCSEDRIPGATKIGSYWAIPADAEKPNDQRIRSGKYIKEKAVDMFPVTREPLKKGGLTFIVFSQPMWRPLWDYVVPISRSA